MLRDGKTPSLTGMMVAVPHGVFSQRSTQLLHFHVQGREFLGLDRELGPAPLQLRPRSLGVSERADEPVLCLGTSPPCHVTTFFRSAKPPHKICIQSFSVLQVRAMALACGRGEVSLILLRREALCEALHLALQ